MLVVFSAAAAQTPVTPVTPASVGSPPPHQPIQLSDLQSILANMNVPAAAAAQGPGGQSLITQACLWVDLFSVDIFTSAGN